VTAFRIVPGGDSTLIVEFDERIDPGVNARAIACADAIQDARVPGVRDVVPTYRSVAIYFDPLHTDRDALTASLEREAGRPQAPAAGHHPRYEPPGEKAYAQAETYEDARAVAAVPTVRPAAVISLAAEARGVLAGLPVTGPRTLAADPAARAALWHIRKGLYAAVAGARPSGTTALLEDIVVPVPALLPTCERLTALFDRHGYADGVIFGHAKDGNIHFMLTERLSGGSLDRFSRFTEDMVALILDQSGSLKAEHGTGRMMAPFVRRQYGDVLYAAMQEIKRLCDPENVLNPGVVLVDDPDSHLRDLKTVQQVESEVDRCVECGFCEPVCPSRNVTTTSCNQTSGTLNFILADLVLTASGAVAAFRYVVSVLGTTGAVGSFRFKR
jgi:ferredoxin